MYAKFDDTNSFTCQTIIVMLIGHSRAQGYNVKVLSEGKLRFVPLNLR